jgi:hypothetical protein
MYINYRCHTTVQEQPEYLPQHQLTQCYNCHQYGHRAASCKNPPQCGQCKSTDHKANKCNIEPMQFKCCNCDGNHEAWNKDIQGNTTLNHTDLIMEPISTTDFTSADVDRIAMETRERMLTVFEDISEKTPNTNGKAINGGASLKKEL